MITVILPATNHKPHWIELRTDDTHTASVWGEVEDVTIHPRLKQFMVSVILDCTTQAFLWADAIEKAEE